MPPSGDALVAPRPVQVAPESYDFEIYDNLERWASYWYQIRAALRLKPRRVLEIGSGTGVFRMYLRSRDIEVLTADIDQTRGVDYLADVSRLDETLPAGETFDIVAAFQVLEHLPYGDFERCLEGIARRARPYALISLP
jgi:2-polyprenyl-3-methyl-5-hydroxy-6-metoxy-1,4-benzoquinol methylase